MRRLIDLCRDGSEGQRHNASGALSIISRNDAARLVVDVVACGRDYDLVNKVVDAAWEAEWGIPAAGTDEAQRAADDQNLLALASQASRPTLPTRLKDEDLRAYPAVVP